MGRVTFTRGQPLAPRPGQPRRVKAVRETSDVSRFKGVMVASVLGTTTVLLGLVVTHGWRGLASPGALSPGHSRAGLECDSCHADKEAANACVGCHAGQTTRREQHRRLFAEGELKCVTCHRAHGETASLVFTPPDGVGIERAGQAKKVKLPEFHFQTRQTTVVPVIERHVCEGCHQADPSDPAAFCLRGSGYQGCFDEHRSVGQAPADRDAAWEASRVVLASGIAPPRVGSAAPALWLLAGLGVAGLSLVLVRRGRRSPRRVVPDATVPLAPERKRLPRVDASTCLGCYACVDVCPFDVLEVRRFVAVVARPDACCGLSLCEQRCPNGSLVVQEGERVVDRPRLAECLESLDVPGLFLAGDLTGLSLIRNAIAQGAHVVETVHARVTASRSSAHSEPAGSYDLLVVGTGPAGLSAMVEAKKAGLRALALEQGSVAESIKSFPRHKLVLDSGTPGAKGSLWLEECTKEELVAKWTYAARRERLAILEQHRVVGVAERGGVGARFVVRALVEGVEREFFARHVLLALGKRGTPRRLEIDIPPAWQNDVHYTLVDARPFQGRRVLVVGSGDSALEAAAALAAQPGAEVTIAARARGFTRGKARNIQTIERLVAQGRISVLFRATLTRLKERAAELDVLGEAREVPVDSVFVLIGSELPWAFLEAAGVRRAASHETSTRKHANDEAQ